MLPGHKRQLHLNRHRPPMGQAPDPTRLVQLAGNERGGGEGRAPAVARQQLLPQLLVQPPRGRYRQQRQLGKEVLRAQRVEQHP